MIRCGRYRRLASRRRDGGALSGAEAAALDAHLGGCAGCRGFDAALGEVGRALTAAIAPASTPARSSSEVARAAIALGRRAAGDAGERADRLVSVGFAGLAAAGLTAAALVAVAATREPRPAPIDAAALIEDGGDPASALLAAGEPVGGGR